MVLYFRTAPLFQLLLDWPRKSGTALRNMNQFCLKMPKLAESPDLLSPARQTYIYQLAVRDFSVLPPGGHTICIIRARVLSANTISMRQFTLRAKGQHMFQASQEPGQGCCRPLRDLLLARSESAASILTGSKSCFVLDGLSQGEALAQS
jgi:hypothetical protein